MLSSGQPYEFIPLDWLKKWLDDSTATKEIDNTPFLCSHGKLHPDMVGDSKRVSHQAAQLLYERYGGGPRLDGKSSVGLSIACGTTIFVASSDWLGKQLMFKQTEVPCQPDSATHKAYNSRRNYRKTAILTAANFSIGLFHLQNRHHMEKVNQTFVAS